MEVKIVIDALECNNFSYILLAYLPSSHSSLPLNTSPDLHIHHLLDEFMKGTSGRAGGQTTHLDLICILSSQLPDRLPLEKDCPKREQGALHQHPPVSMKQRQDDRE